MSEGTIFLIIIIGLIVSGWVFGFVFRRKFNQQLNETERVRRSVDHLWQYEGIHDADEHAKGLISSAEKIVQNAQQRAEKILADAELESKQTTHKRRTSERPRCAPKSRRSASKRRTPSKADYY